MSLKVLMIDENDSIESNICVSPSTIVSSPSPSGKTKSKRSWNQDEDLRLLKLIEEHCKGGIYNEFDNIRWTRIGEKVGNRTGKQCRERYFNHLKKGLVKTRWTETEDAMILKKYDEYGPRWSLIAKSLVGRPDNAVKNRWHLIHRRTRKKKTEEDSRTDAAISLLFLCGGKSNVVMNEHLLCSPLMKPKESLEENSVAEYQYSPIFKKELNNLIIDDKMKSN